MAAGEIVDILLRGMCAGALILLAIAFGARRPPSWRSRLGAAFAFGTAAYVLVTSPAIVEALGPLYPVAQTLSVVTPVIFWWFALALFDDGFRWRWPFFVPLAVIAPAALAFFAVGRVVVGWGAAIYLMQAVMVFMYGHAVWTALRYFNDDLIEGRRRFRIVFAIAVAATGLIITYVEATTGAAAARLPLRLFQAAAILTLTLAFGAWLTATRAELLDGPAAPRPPAETPTLHAKVRAADRPAFDALTRLMNDGVYKEEGLTVAGLAGRVGVPEHQLRQLINGQLGARNFSAFLNARRIADARTMLADPSQARRQILQIALDLGYGSIAPFNRAFKEATRMTPTEYRKKALGEG